MPPVATLPLAVLSVPTGQLKGAGTTQDMVGGVILSLKRVMPGWNRVCLVLVNLGEAGSAPCC